MELTEAKHILSHNGFKLIKESRNHGLFVHNYTKNLDGLDDDDIDYFKKKVYDMGVKDWDVALDMAYYAAKSGKIQAIKKGLLDEEDLLKELCEEGKKQVIDKYNKSAQKWIDDVLKLDPDLEDAIEEALYEMYDCYTDDCGSVYTRDGGRDSEASSVFDYVYNDSYCNLESALGTPEEFVKECNS